MLKDKILEAIGTFKYSPDVLKTFKSILGVRFARDSEVCIQMEKFLSAKRIKSSFLEALDEASLEEIKRLNLANLQARLAVLLYNQVVETVVIAYMKALVAEIQTQPIVSPSSSLIEAESKMFEHLINEARYNDDLTGLEGISNLNLRLVLQTWVLYPELLYAPEKCEELLECLSISSYEF